MPTPSSDAKPVSAREKPPAPASGMPLHDRIFYAGVAVFIAGMAGAVLIYASAADGTAGDPATEYLNRRLTEFEIERIGGMATVYVARFNLWLAGLWHGKPLAFTVAAFSIIIALLCFWISGRKSESSPDDRDEGPGG